MVQPDAHEHEQAPPREADPDDLLSTLEVIEAQPLVTRAEAYDALHDTLARRLEAVPNGAPPHAPGASAS